VLFFALTISSCGKFSEGVIQEIPFPEHIPRLTATLIVNDQDDKIFAQISSSASVLDAEGPQTVQGAVVTLTDEAGQTLYALTESDFYDSVYILSLDNTFGSPLGLTTLTVDAPGFAQATATNTMPSKPIFDLTYEYQGDSSSSPWGGPSLQDVYTFDFGNNFGVQKNYLIHIDARFINEETGDTLEWETLHLDWYRTREDPRITRLSIQDSSSGAMVTDESSSSSAAALSNIKVLTKSNGSPISKRVRVESLSPELAKFYLSLDSYLSSADDFFAEPSLIYSNVSSGFGCFGLSSQTIVEIN
jgi:hypothetical protein